MFNFWPRQEAGRTGQHQIQIQGAATGFRWHWFFFRPKAIGSMVLVYMLTWLGYIDGIHVTIYTIHGSYGKRLPLPFKVQLLKSDQDGHSWRQMLLTAFLTVLWRPFLCQWVAKPKKKILHFGDPKNVWGNGESHPPTSTEALVNNLLSGLQTFWGSESSESPWYIKKTQVMQALFQ